MTSYTHDIAYDLLHVDPDTGGHGSGRVGELTLWIGDGYDVVPKHDYEMLEGGTYVLKAHKTISELCRLCAYPLILDRPPGRCEFSSPGVWWRGDRPEYCKCNGCSTSVKAHGQRYCGKTCKARVDNARDRLRRRLAGALPRGQGDPEADRLAFMEWDTSRRVAERKASDHYPRW